MTNKKTYSMTIGGKSLDGKSQSEVLNPFDLSVVGLCPAASFDDLETAVAAAREAFRDWSKTSDSARAKACLDVAGALEENASELTELITKEQGKPLDAGGFGAGFEVGGCIGWSQATSALKLEDKTILDENGVTAVQKRVPVGVVGSITPWNWPLLIAIWHILPAIRAGNTVVIKPSPNTPLSTLRAVELMNTVLPDGVVNVVTGDGEIGARMSSHPGIDKIIFTGSTATGKRVMASASENVTRCTLELGGNDPAVVLPGAPVTAMAEGIYFGAFINAGQTCGAIKRVYVHEDQYDEACDALAMIAKQKKTGNGLEDGIDMGPLQNKMQYDKVRSLMDAALEDGAERLCGGDAVGQGYALTPSILKHCRPGMAIVDEEQFGPALPVISYKSLDEAVAMANAGEFGLCASVWGLDEQQLDRVSEHLEAGTVYINTHAELNPIVPFGGVKSSGIGVQFGEEGLSSMTNSKIVYHRKG